MPLTAPPRTDLPQLVGDGPPECSSSTELSVLPYIVWDVNNYYAELGVPFWANRRQLREAYQAKDGPNDARLTYILKQLVNAEIRRAYDMMPFGSVFMDRYVADALKKQMLHHKAERMQNLRDLGVDMDAVNEESIERDIYHEMGVLPDDQEDGDTPPETVDEVLKKAQDVARPATRFPYAYYLYKVRFPGRELVQRLEEWQRFLVSALAREGIRIHFAVGLHGEPSRWLLAQVGYRKAFFLSVEHMPSAEMAALVAKQYREQFGPAYDNTPLAITER